MNNDMDFFQKESQGQACFIIKTPSAEYHYQGEAGGFSSLIDHEGRDWIAFKPSPVEVPVGASGIFRGLPNLIFPDNIGHPGYQFCQSCLTECKDFLLIETESFDKLWAWNWVFYRDSARFTMTRTPGSRRFWFLYEGPVGGVFEPQKSFWGTDSLGQSRLTPELISRTPQPVLDSWQWIYFGHDKLDHVFYINHETTQNQSCLFSYMGGDNKGLEAEDGMVVAGFGRTGETRPLLNGKHIFTMGFMNTVDHESIKKRLDHRNRS
jgi:hypothetical protein